MVFIMSVEMDMNNNNNNNGNRIETPKLIQRQRDIIRSQDIKPAITTAVEQRCYRYEFR